MTKILSDTVLASTRYVKLVQRFFQKDGNIYDWTFAQRNNDRSAVMIIPYYDDRLVITKEYRVPLADFEWGFPAGIIDEGEAPHETAIRELKEETGLDVKEIIYETPFVFNSAGITDEKIALVYVRAEGKLSTDHMEAQEDIETFVMSRDEVKALLRSNKCFSAKAYMEMQEFVRRGAL